MQSLHGSSWLANQNKRAHPPGNVSLFSKLGEAVTQVEPSYLQGPNCGGPGLKCDIKLTTTRRSGPNIRPGGELQSVSLRLPMRQVYSDMSHSNKSGNVKEHSSHMTPTSGHHGLVMCGRLF